MIRSRFICASAFALMVSTLPFAAQAQLLTDDAITPEQRAVGAVFDTQGLAAAPGSSLDQDYSRILSGTSAEVTTSVQSMLPTTAYSMTGAANTLASSQERGIMGRLRTLRHGEKLTPSKAVEAPRAPVIYPLQDTDEALHDLRTGKKATPQPNAHGTTNNYRMYNPALYRDSHPDLQPPSKKYLAERAYDESMRLATIGAGAPNEYYRETGQHNLRIVPNMADRETTKALKTAGDLAGQSQVYATAQDGMPRRTIVTARDKDRAASSNYRGQPLSNIAASEQQIPVPMAMPSAPVQPQTLTNDPYEAADPVIYGAGETAPAQATAPAQDRFTYKKIDQKEGMTTPRIGSPSRSTLNVRQSRLYAMLSSSETNVVGRVPTRRTTDAGALLWTENEAEKPSVTQEDRRALTATIDDLPLLAQSPDASEKQEAPAYGREAIRLSENGAINADRRWGFFMAGDTGFGSDKLQAESNKAKNVTAGFTAGADYRLNDKSYLGLALTYAHSSFTTTSYGDLKTNSTALSLYGTTQYAAGAYVDGYISVGYHAMDSARTIFAGAGTTQKAKSSPDGFQFNGKAETGYEAKYNALRYGPFAGFRLAYADFGSVTESDAGNFNLKTKGFNNLSAIGSVGVDAAHRMVMSNGGTLSPALRVGYNHEFGDDHTNIKAEFVNLANSGFTTKSNKKSRDWLNLTPSITANLPNDWSFVAQYEHDFFRDDVNENIFNLAAHYKW